MHGMCVPLILKAIQLTLTINLMPRLHFKYIKQPNGSIRVEVITLEEYTPPTLMERLLAKLKQLGSAAAYAIHR